MSRFRMSGATPLHPLRAFMSFAPPSTSNNCPYYVSRLRFWNHFPFLPCVLSVPPISSSSLPSPGMTSRRTKMTKLLSIQIYRASSLLALTPKHRGHTQVKCDDKYKRSRHSSKSKHAAIHIIMQPTENMGNNFDMCCSVHSLYC